MVNRPLLVWSGTNLAPKFSPLLGGKAANLAALQAIGRPVPPFYVITTEAYHLAVRSANLQERIAQRLSETPTDSESSLRKAAAEIREWLQAIKIPPELTSAIADHEWSGQESLLAVRSSVADEDARGHSFAGLHDSVLGVRGRESLVEAVKQVWASAYNDQALIYRRRMQISLENITVAVIVQQMIRPRSSGVMFTVNPVTGNVQELMIGSLFGAGEGLVSVGLDADRHVVEKESLAIKSEVASKEEQFLFDEPSGKLQRVSVPHSFRSSSSLSQQEVETIARAGLAIERHFGRPQDVEFVFDNEGHHFVLQARPVTTVEEYGPAAGNHLIWDNSNIIESYSGVTSPMTFSFIRRAYTIVYHCFAEVMGISAKVVRKNKATFENMLGFHRGRVYYNLLNWYRLLRLFPGFYFNKQFLESMMGLKQTVQLQDEDRVPGLVRRYFVELPALVRLLLRSGWNFLRIRSTVRRFNEHFESCYARWRAIDFHSNAPHELMNLYQMMEDTLLWNWKAPIINDFYVMVYCGALKKLCRAWAGDLSGSLQNDLLCGEGGIASAEPTKMLLGLARMAAKNPDLKNQIMTAPPEVLAREIPSDARFSAFATAFQQYLELYGARRMNELKLEEYSLRDKPGFLYQIIRNYMALENPAALDPDAAHQREQRIRAQAEARAFGALGRSPGSFWKTRVFRRVLQNTRLGVKNREQMRFARTRIYDLLRDLIRSIASRLADEGILDAPDDVFYLTLEEVWDYIKGTAVTTDLRGLAVLRRKECEAYDREVDSAPDSRFETYGMACHRNLFKNRRSAAASVAQTDGILRGTPCSSGEATGTVRVFQTPSVDTQLCGEILVAERTDPGWVPLYPTVSGILVERGSILSHSAIVAREMGIPTIVGIQGLMKSVQTGDRVAMDGSTGTVRVLTKQT